MLTITQERWIDIREPGTNRLLFRLNPTTLLVSVKQNGMRVPVTVDLKQYLPFSVKEASQT